MNTFETQLKDGRQVHAEYNLKRGRYDHDNGLYLEDLKIKVYDDFGLELPVSDELESEVYQWIINTEEKMG